MSPSDFSIDYQQVTKYNLLNFSGIFEKIIKKSTEGHK